MTSLTATISSSKIDNILLAHDMSDCDTTGIFWIGKRKFFKSSILKEEAEFSWFFLNVGSSIKDILDAGTKILSILYGKHGCDTAELGKKQRKGWTHELIIKRKFHILTVFHAVQAWLGEDLDPPKFSFCEYN